MEEEQCQMILTEEKPRQFRRPQLRQFQVAGKVSGARYDAVDKVLYLQPTIKGDFRSFLSTASGYGLVGVRNGQLFVEVVSGTIPYTKIDYQAVR